MDYDSMWPCSMVRLSQEPYKAQVLFTVHQLHVSQNGCIIRQCTLPLTMQMVKSTRVEAEEGGKQEMSRRLPIS